METFVGLLIVAFIVGAIALFVYFDNKHHIKKPTDEDQDWNKLPEVYRIPDPPVKVDVPSRPVDLEPKVDADAVSKDEEKRITDELVVHARQAAEAATAAALEANAAADGELTDKRRKRIVKHATKAAAAAATAAKIALLKNKGNKHKRKG